MVLVSYFSLFPKISGKVSHCNYSQLFGNEILLTIDSQRFGSLNIYKFA